MSTESIVFSLLKSRNPLFLALEKYGIYYFNLHFTTESIDSSSRKSRKPLNYAYGKILPGRCISMLRRKIYDKIMDWKSREHKPLVLKGPRQVGKTFILKHFAAENYAHCYYIDFATDGPARRAFGDSLDVDTIILGLRVNRPETPLIPGKTLLIFDEIQDCPRADQSLKSFAEDGRYDVVASGSLLGLNNYTLKNNEDRPGDPIPLTPIGQTEEIVIRSLDFEEFLWAAGFDESMIAPMKAALRDRTALSASLLESFDRLYRDYMIVGGMPDAVNAFFETRSFARVASAQDRILSRHQTDITKYNSKKEAEKIQDVIRSIPWQLSMDGKTFTYSRITDGESTNENRTKYFRALEWVKNAGYANMCYNVRSPVHPLESQVKRDDFKIYFTDTGLLVRMMGPDVAEAIYYGDISCNLGAVAENAVAEGILKSGLPIRYYKKTGGEDRMELDFVIERGRSMSAIEVKSGRSRKSPSLSKARSVFRFDRRIKFGKTNIFVDDNGVENYPLFACAFINEIIPKGPIDFGDFPDYMM